MKNWRTHLLPKLSKDRFEMTSHVQLPLFADAPIDRPRITPVNVASVPQRSPFRYPGGKTWFVPTARLWLRYVTPRPKLLVEPFAGGGIISLTSVFEGLVESAIMVELDENVASVWRTVLGRESEWLVRRILSFDISVESVASEIRARPKSQRERAFQTILRNRTCHGGILAEGSGLLKHGENGKGIRSRWYPETLATRIRNLRLVANRISFRCEDGIEVMSEFAKRRDTAFFVDPPYTAGGKKAGRRLYPHCEIDHEQLFSTCARVKGSFVLTYDDAPEVRGLARQYGFDMRLIPMTNTHHAVMEELVIGNDLSFLDSLPAVHEPKANYDARKGSTLGHQPALKAATGTRRKR